jgi:hypothetical protein
MEDSDLLPPSKAEQVESRGFVQGSSWIGWLPVSVLPLIAIACRNLLTSWGFMWILAFTIFIGLKWVTWWKARLKVEHPAWRATAYLLAWPGMDAEAFLDIDHHVLPSPAKTWVWASLETALGAALLWVVARSVPQRETLLRGWFGMLGLILLLHFGTFQIVGLMWQSIGVKAAPIMTAPLRSVSLGEFWGRRWNLGFRQLAHELVFRSLHRTLGAGLAGFCVFVVSGLIHDLVISLPARGGYGLPTAYFVVQGAGMTIERSTLGKRIGLGRGWIGRLFMALFVVGPLFWLFHPWFVLRVILPFMHAIHAL